MIAIIFTFLFANNLYATVNNKTEQNQQEDLLHEPKDWQTRNEFYLYGGYYFGDSLESSLMAGAEYMFHIDRHFGFGVDFGYTKADFNENIYYSQPGFFTNTNTYILDANAMFSVPVSFYLGKHRFDNDIFALIGVGTIYINNSFKPQGFFGGGIKTYLVKHWLALRTEVKQTFHTTGKPGGVNELDIDVMFVTGLSFQLPPKI